MRISGSAVFDAWAILAWLRDEPAASRVDEILQQAADGDLQLSMSWINAGEAYIHRWPHRVFERGKPV